MTCDATRRRLLAAERPAHPPLEVKRHLAGCAACRAWHHALVDLEQQASALPAPPFAGKARLAALFRTPAPAPRPAAGPAPAPLPLLRVVRPAPLETPAKERGLRKAALAVALAAAVVLLAVGLWSWPRPAGPSGPPVAQAPRPLENIRVRHAGRMTLARTPRQKVEALADFADDLHAEARRLAREPGDGSRDLGDVTGDYVRVVGVELMASAEAVPAGERPAVLRPVAAQLAETESRVERLLAELAPPGASVAAAGPLRDIASASREGDRRLRRLIDG
jgi:hypothetical protein